MIPYSIHVAILLAICLFFYKLLLQKETYYGLNRIILLSCLALAFVLPLIPVPQQFSLQGNTESMPEIINSSPIIIKDELIGHEAEASVKQSIAKADPVLSTDENFIPAVFTVQNVIKWAFWIYWCGVLIFGANLLVQIIVLLYQVYKKPAIRDGIYRIIELDDDKAPCSFGNSIFINPAKYDWKTYNQILMHEKVHIQQRHSFDLIIAELMLVVQWFNPFAWLYRKELESNLEFLTDYSVLQNNEVEAADYQLSLLKVSVPNFSMRIVTNYNQSLLKKRIIMMNAKRSNIHIVWKYLMLLPLFILFVCCLNKPVAAESNFLTGKQKNKQSIQAKEEVSGLEPTVKIALNLNDNAKTLKTVLQTKPGEVTAAYVKSFRDIGYRDTSPEVMRVFYTAGVTAAYVKSFMDIGYGKELSPEAVLAYKKVNLTAAYIKSLMDIGYDNLSSETLVTGTALGITPSYIKGFTDIGYKILSLETLFNYKALGITPVYIKELMNMGYKDTSLEDVVNLKRSGVIASGDASAEPVTGNSLSQAGDTSLKEEGVTASYVRDFMNIRYPYTDSKTLVEFKKVGITAVYVKDFTEIRYGYTRPENLIEFKKAGITAAYVKDFTEIRYPYTRPENLVEFKKVGITAAYVKDFTEIRYPYTRPENLVEFKKVGITAAYVKDFTEIRYGYTRPENLIEFKKAGITAAYVKDFTEIRYPYTRPENLIEFKKAGMKPK